MALYRRILAEKMTRRGGDAVEIEVVKPVSQVVDPFLQIGGGGSHDGIHNQVRV